MQDVYDVGSALGSTGMGFETWDSKVANGSMKILNPELQTQIQVSEESQEKNLPSVDTKTDYMYVL